MTLRLGFVAVALLGCTSAEVAAERERVLGEAQVFAATMGLRAYVCDRDFTFRADCSAMVGEKPVRFRCRYDGCGWLP